VDEVAAAVASSLDETPGADETFGEDAGKGVPGSNR
jgi:hypothetical protein